MLKTNTILIVDDEEIVRKMLVDMLTELGHHAETAQDGIEALAKLNLDIDLILLDVRMPGMDGFEVARKIREKTAYNDVPIIMVTGLSGHEDRLRAVEAGANDFISKPFDFTELRVRTDSLLKIKASQDMIKLHKENLERTVEKRTSTLRSTLNDLVEAQRNLQGAYQEIIQRLSIAAEFKDENTAAHIYRMSHFSALLAEKIKMSPGEVELLLRSSPMHDVGKIGVDDGILMKPSGLSEVEWKVIRRHPDIGGEILRDSSSDLLQLGELIARSHHEKWDGSGYPQGLSGDNIPLEGRICAITDVFDALTSIRPYKQAFSNQKALEIINREKDGHFDPKLVKVFIDNIDEFIAIQEMVRKGECYREIEIT